MGLQSARVRGSGGGGGGGAGRKRRRLSESMNGIIMWIFGARCVRVWVRRVYSFLVVFVVVVATCGFCVASSSSSANADRKQRAKCVLRALVLVRSWVSLELLFIFRGVCVNSFGWVRVFFFFFGTHTHTNTHNLYALLARGVSACGKIGISSECCLRSRRTMICT